VLLEEDTVAVVLLEQDSQAIAVDILEGLVTVGNLSLAMEAHRILEAEVSRWEVEAFHS